MNREQRSSKTTPPGIARAVKQLAALGLALGLAGATVPATQARNAALPYLESLEALQQRAYAQAAPSGQDAAPVDSGAMIPAPAPALAVEQESRLEQLALEQQGPLSLEQTQQGQVLPSDLEQYGYDIFNRTPVSLSAIAGIPVPVNYRLGPGDNVIVQLFGKRNVEYNLVVTRDGNILVPEYGPVNVTGLTFDEAERLLVEGFERRVIGARAVVTMGRLRTIQLVLAGDVVQPGIYTVGGLSTLIDALLTTGGVRRTGSLRNIQLIRGGKTIARLDLYDLLQRGISEGEVYLEHNDTIFVPPIGDIVYVGGEVQRPAIYELGNERTVGQLVKMAGGLLPTASLDHSLIERIQASGTRTLVDFAASDSHGSQRAILDTAIHNGDFLRILPLEDQLEDVIVLSGHVKRPGAFQFRPGMRVSDALPSADALLPGADIDFLLIKREQGGTLRTEAVYVDLAAVLASPGGAQDLALQARDQLVAFNLAEPRQRSVANIVRELDTQATHSRPARVIETRGALRYTGRLPLQENAQLLDVIALGGGLQPGADLHYGVIARPRHPGQDIEVIAFNSAAAMADPASIANRVIMPGDRLYFFAEAGDRSALIARELEQLRRQASYGADDKLVTVMGEVLHPGTYPLTPGMRASDLLCAARGLTRRAWGLGAELSKVRSDPTMDSKVQHIALDSAHLLGLCEQGRQAARGDLGDTKRSELQAHYTDDKLNPLLTPLDQLSFVEKSGWVDRASVTLVGEVQRPGVYAIDRGETLCQVMQRAGGLTDEAYSFGAQFSRRLVREVQQRTLEELQGQLDELMVELSLSHSFNNVEKTSTDTAPRPEYLRTIRQLERAEANGRMVIDLDRIMKCRSRDDLALEDGDTLTVPDVPHYVEVAGQVYVPTAHLYREDRRIADYVELSGGQTVLGRLKDTYVIQANGEVLNFKRSRSSSRIARKTVMPGARILVPIDVDRMNSTEKAQSWVSSLMQTAILAGIVL